MSLARFAVASVTLVVLAPSISRADIVLFDPDGSGGASGSLQVNTFDPSPGNVLAVNAIDPATGSIRVGTPFQVLYQARIGTLLDVNNRVIAAPGTGALGELTIVASFNEIATTGSASAATFSTNTNQANSFVRIYFDAANDSNDLAGTGFANGTLIYEGRVTQDGTGSFGTTSSSIEALDQNGTNNYTGVTSVVGGGGTRLNATTVFANTSFFTGALPVLNLNFNTTTNTPFNQVDPSAAFFNGAPGVSSVGAINGRSGPNFIFQADASASFTVVPEPASVAMTLLGLGGVGFGSLAARRRRARAAA